jgi:hypothetical protein
VKVHQNTQMPFGTPEDKVLMRQVKKFGFKI